MACRGNECFFKRIPFVIGAFPTQYFLHDLFQKKGIQLSRKVKTKLIEENKLDKNRIPHLELKLSERTKKNIIIKYFKPLNEVSVYIS